MTKTIYWPDNNTIDNREFHISRNKIKEMCIMPTFIMKEIIKVIKENETTDIAIPLWNVVPGEYEEYAYQVLNSNADKEKFNYHIYRTDLSDTVMFIGLWSINCRNWK